MENQGTRDSAANRPNPTGGFAGTGAPSPDTGGATPPFRGAERFATTGTGHGFASAAPEQAGVEAQSGVAEGQGQDQGGGTMAKVDAGIEKAAEGMDKLVGAIRDRGQQMEGGSGPAGTVGSVAATAADKLEGASQYLHQTDADRLISDLEALVRREPAKALLVAAGIGFVLAKALK